MPKTMLLSRKRLTRIVDQLDDLINELNVRGKYPIPNEVWEFVDRIRDEADDELEG